MIIKVKLEDYVQKQLLVALRLYLCNIIVGYAVGWSSSVVIKLQDPNQTPLNDIISDGVSSWVGSIYLFGIFTGPYISGPLSNIIGRKYCMLLGNCINAGAQIILALSYNIAMVLAGRLISGFGIGMILVTNTVYIGEISSSNIRGIILTCTGIFHTLGILIAYIVGANVSYATISFIGLGIDFVHLVATLTLPESPMFYILKGDEVNAKKVLCELGRGKDVENELKTMADNVKEYENKNTNWTELFTLKSNRMSMLISVVMIVLQYIAGILAALFFTQTIFEKAGTSIDSSLQAIIIGVTQFFGTLCVPFLIERSGRKTLSLVSIAGCGIGMTVLGVYFHLSRKDELSVSNLGWLPLAAMILAFFSYSIGLNITPNTLACEMFTPNVRSIGTSIAFNIGALFGFISTTTFGYIINAIGEDFTFWMFGIINVLGFLFTLFVVPETKGMTLVEIEQMLSK